MKKNRELIVKMIISSIMAAMAVVLQLFTIRFGEFMINLGLIPIAVGCILAGPIGGAFIGFFSGLYVMLSGDAAAFIAISGVGTWLTVLLKGILSGVIPGTLFLFFKKKRKITLGVIVCSILVPIVNTGIFTIGFFTFFSTSYEAVVSEAGKSMFIWFFSVMIGANFLIELAINTVASPVIARICQIGFKELHIDLEK